MSRPTWTDITSYRKSDPPGTEPRSWDLRAGWVRVVVTRHKDHAADVWTLTCLKTGHEQHPLHAKDIGAAKAEALRVVEAGLVAMLDDLRKAM